MDETTPDTPQADTPEEGHLEVQDAPAPDLLERIVSWISMLILLAAAGFLVWEGLGTATPPNFRVQTHKTWTARGRHYVQLHVENTGGQSVQNLGLRVALKENSRTVATSEAQISWLPARSSREAVVIFEEDPRPRRIDVHLLGYETP